MSKDSLLTNKTLIRKQGKKVVFASCVNFKTERCIQYFNIHIKVDIFNMKYAVDISNGTYKYLNFNIISSTSSYSNVFLLEPATNANRRLLKL